MSSINCIPTSFPGPCPYLECGAGNLYFYNSSGMNTWERFLADEVFCSRTATSAQEPIEEVELHAFEAASGKGISAAVYAVVKQPSTLV